MIDTEKYAYAMGAVLLQLQNDSNLNERATISSRIQTLNKAEQNYSATKRECLVVIWTIQLLRPYITET